MWGDGVVRWLAVLGDFCSRQDKPRAWATPGRSVRIQGSVAILCLASTIGIVAGISASRAENRIDTRRTTAPVIEPASRVQQDDLAAAAPGIGAHQSAQATKASIARRAYRKGEYKTAFRIWEQLANKGDPEAQHMLGVMHENGEGVPMDPVKAAEWYRKAAIQGNSEAQLNLGVLYENGEGVRKDLHQAAEWYRKAAEQDELLAQFSLGIMYRQGRGVPRNDKQAARLLTKVAQRGYALPTGATRRNSR